jgi:hypothetical protein
MNLGRSGLVLSVAPVRATDLEKGVFKALIFFVLQTFEIFVCREEFPPWRKH